MKGPMIILNPCAQSHPFEERRCRVGNAQDPLKIGRSVARLKPAPDNAIFDCKVLSRNHAILWYSNGAFMLKDTKSSNGTFVNNERLAQTGEDSEPRQINTGDIIQFGVEIVENANKISHGCILAMVRLFDENGEEVESQVGTLETSLSNQSISGSIVNSQQLFQMQQFLKEALLREKYRDEKIAQLESQLMSADVATDNAWKSFLNEDRLLARIAILEDQLALYQKNKTGDTLRNDMEQLLIDKAKFTNRAREEIVKAQEQRAEAELRLNDTERSLLALEEDYQIIKQRQDVVNQYNATLSSAMEELKNENKRLMYELELKATAELLKSESEHPLGETYDILPPVKAEPTSEDSETSSMQAAFDNPSAQKEATIEGANKAALQANFTLAAGSMEVRKDSNVNDDAKEMGQSSSKELIAELVRLREEHTRLQEVLALRASEIGTLLMENAALRSTVENEPNDPSWSPRSTSQPDEMALHRVLPHQDNMVLLSIIPIFSMIILLFGYIYSWIARKIGYKQD